MKKLCYRVLIKWLIVVSMLSLFLWMTILCFWQSNAQKMVSFDMQATIHQFVRQIDAQPHLSPAKKQAEVSAFSHAMIIAVNQYATTHHVTILLSQTVVAGVSDRTQVIQRRIAALMHPG